MPDASRQCRYVVISSGARFPPLHRKRAPLGIMTYQDCLPASRKNSAVSMIDPKFYLILFQKSPEMLAFWMGIFSLFIIYQIAMVCWQILYFVRPDVSCWISSERCGLLHSGCTLGIAFDCTGRNSAFVFLLDETQQRRRVDVRQHCRLRHSDHFRRKSQYSIRSSKFC